MKAGRKMENFRLAIMRLFLKRLKKQAQAGRISNVDIMGLCLCWGNLFYSAGWRYLRQVVKHTLDSDKDILECGSGLTTAIIGTLTEPGIRNVYVLEHNKDWLNTLDARLKALNINHIELVHAPLVRYGTYAWYSTTDSLFEQNTLDLIVCDGPPSSTLGGRFGLVPRISPYLAKQSTILLDDTHRPSEKRILKIWRQMIEYSLCEKRGLVSQCSVLFIQRAV